MKSDSYKYDRLRLSYLLAGSCDILPPSYAKLRSYLNIHVANIVERKNMGLLKDFRSRNRACLYCYSLWNGDTTSFKLLPSKRYRTPKAPTGTTANDKRETHELNESRNTLVLKCKVCTKRSSFSLVKWKPPLEEVTKDSVILVKKKKKKRDKSCGLAVDLIKPKQKVEKPILKDSTPKEKRSFLRMENKEKGGVENPVLALGVQPKGSPNIALVPKNLVNVKSENIAPNPFATQIQKSLSKKKVKKLERLKQAVKGEKNLAKKTLQDFLTLV